MNCAATYYDNVTLSTATRLYYINRFRSVLAYNWKISSDKYLLGVCDRFKNLSTLQ